MISRSSVIRIYIAWYDFKILCYTILIYIYKKITQIIIVMGVNRFRSMPEQGWVVRGQPIPE
jgi:hypothetical protein